MSILSIVPASCGVPVIKVYYNLLLIRSHLNFEP